MSTTSVGSPGGGHTGVDKVRVGILGLGLVGVLAATALGSTPLAGIALMLGLIAVSLRAIESWPIMITGLLIVIFMIPIKVYRLPINLPFDLEPYRILVFAMTVVWVAALLVDRRVKLRRTVFDLPMLLLLFSVLASISANVDFIYELDVSTDVVKAVTFFTSFVLVYFVIATVVTERAHVEYLIKAIVLCSAVLALSGVVEYRTGFNVFNHISQVLPVLHFEGVDSSGLERSARLRVYASAQHPIAYGALLAMILPIAIYMALTRKRRFWWFVVFLIGLGSLSSLSRTAITAVFASGLALLFVRPREAKRLFPLMLPALVVTFFVLPNALGTFKSAFFPHGGLVAEQDNIQPGNELYGNGRLADIGPTLDQWRERPIFGRGYGSRIVGLVPRANAAILDDQWLDLLLDIGALGFAAFGWLVFRGVRRLGKIARGDPSDLGLLAGCLASAVVSYAAGLITYDGFGDIQVTLVFFVLLGIGAAVVALKEQEERVTAPLDIPRGQVMTPA